MGERAIKRRKLSPPDEHDESVSTNDESSDAGDVAAPTLSTQGDLNDEIEDDELFDEGTEPEDEKDNGDFAAAANAPTKARSLAASATAQPGKAKSHGAVDMTRPQVFKAQAESLLRRITPAYGEQEAAAERMLRSLKTTIEEIPAQQPLPISQAQRNIVKIHKVRVPFSTQPTPDAKYRLGFAKPTNINVIGSYALKTSTRINSRLDLDMVVTMPEELLSEKDFLDHRFFHKRAYYLARIAAAIRDNHGDLVIQYQNFQDNELLPVLRIKAGKQNSVADFLESDCDILVHITAPDAIFPPRRTLPDSCCIRGDEGKTSPTPYYNGSIRHALSMTSYLRLLHATASRSPGYRQACLLGRVWLQKRGLTSAASQGGFGNFEWASTLALLLLPDAKTGKSTLLPTLDGVQLFRATVQFLARRDLIQQPFVINDGHKVARTQHPMIFDGPNATNILYKMTPWSYRILQQEARTSLKTLSNSLLQQFDPTFTHQVAQRSMQYDMTLSVPLDSILTANNASGKVEQVHNLLKEGLGDRINLIDVVCSPTTETPLSTNTKGAAVSRHITVSLSIEPANATRAVDRGPSAESIDAVDAFKAFWGDKAELRRFKDGSIVYSAVWTQTESFAILEEIVSWLFSLHFSVSPDTITFRAYQAVDVLGFEDRAYKQAADMISTTYKELETKLRTAKGLPLEVRHVAPASPLLSNTSLLSAMSSGGLHMPQAADLVLQFEGSTRWPTDLRAVQVTKTAFLLKMEEVLREELTGVKTQLVLENLHSETLNVGSLEITYSSGVKFNIRIHHEREQGLIQQQLKNKALPPQARDGAATALSYYKSHFVQLPLHTQAMQKASTRCPALPGAVRLLKKWFSAHMLLPHFQEQVIELLAAQAFLHPSTWNVPATGSVAFFRSLHYISQWDWPNEPWTVDFGGSMTATDYEAIRTRFNAWRTIDPTLARVGPMFATDFDNDCSTWTENRPSKVVTNRLVALARSAIKYIQSNDLQSLQSLFKSGLKDFDFVIEIASEFTARASAGKKTKYKNLQVTTATGTDDGPVRVIRSFVAELERLYGDVMILFWDYTGDKGVIAGLWNPRVTQARRWKVNLEYSTVSARGNDKEVTLNATGVLAEIARLGGDMISSIKSS